MGEPKGDRNSGTFGKFFPPVHRLRLRMTALSSMEYPHWLMIAGALLLMLGLVGFALPPRGGEAEPSVVSDQAPPEPEDNVNQVEGYNRVAQEKRKVRWAERFDDAEEPEKLGQGSK
jgi:hypothetical protein